jgi:hypothetical protein
VTGGETLGVGPNHQDWVKLPIPDVTAAIGRYIQGRLTKTVFSVERGITAHRLTTLSNSQSVHFGAWNIVLY